MRKEKEMPVRFYDAVTEFVFVEQEAKRADVLFIPGSGHGELALKAARLWQEGYAGRIVVSGKYSTLTGKFAGVASPPEYAGRMYETECDFLTDVLLAQGVPKEAILQEREATFTFENAIKSRELLEAEGFFETPRERRGILVCQAFHARRSLMYYQLVFPELEWLVCPAVTKEITRDNWQESPEKIDVVLGEMKRIGTQFGDILKGTDQVWKKNK